MTKTACVFPGQGSQCVGMGRDIFDAYPAASTTFKEADSVLGFGLSEICFDGPEEKLRETRYTQLAILVHSVAVWRIMEEKGFRPDFVAGHSVGEYAALVANRAVSFTDALRLVRVRAEAMFASGVERPGAMAALIGINDRELDGLLTEARKAGVVEPANYNSSVQVVVSGEVSAVEKAVELARSFGAKRAIRLNVSGAFHSPLMKVAEDRLADALSEVSFSRAEIPLVSNVTAKSLTEPEGITTLLKMQLTKPVLWRQSMEYIIDQGVDLFAELGPGNILCGLLRRINPGVRCASCSEGKAIEAFFEEVLS